MKSRFVLPVRRVNYVFISLDAVLLVDKMRLYTRHSHGMCVAQMQLACWGWRQLASFTKRTRLLCIHRHPQQQSRYTPQEILLLMHIWTSSRLYPWPNPKGATASTLGTASLAKMRPLLRWDHNHVRSPQCPWCHKLVHRHLSRRAWRQVWCSSAPLPQSWLCLETKCARAYWQSPWVSPWCRAHSVP